MHEGQRHQEASRAKDEQRRSMSAPATQKPAKKAPPMHPSIPAPQLKTAVPSDVQPQTTHAPDWYESYAPAAVDAKATPTKAGAARHDVQLNDASRSDPHRFFVSRFALIHPAATSPPYTES